MDGFGNPFGHPRLPGGSGCGRGRGRGGGGRGGAWPPPSHAPFSGDDFFDISQPASSSGGGGGGGGGGIFFPGMGLGEHLPPPPRAAPPAHALRYPSPIVGGEVGGGGGLLPAASIGHDDLHPIPLLLRPQAGGGGGGGGSIMDGTHPLFGDGPDGRGFGRSPPTLPPGSVPPGARFDPITPDLPGNFPGNIPSNIPRGIPRGVLPPPSGEPDNDEMMPPGFRDMYQ